MKEFLLVLVLLVCLVKPLAGVEQRPRLPTMRLTPVRSPGAPVAVAFWSCLLPLPMALLLESGRAELEQNRFYLVLLVASPVVAFALVKLVAPERLKKRFLVLAARAALLLALVVAAELALLEAGVPSLRTVGPLWAISFAVAAAFLSCLRITDSGYFPLVLLWSAAKRALVAVVVGYWVLSTGDTLTPDPPTADRADQLVALLMWSVVAMACGCALVALWRLVRWLRLGPPAEPAPPGVSYWPPAPGEVWTAEITHDDDTYKERPVVVLERTPHHVRVLGITSVDKSDRPRQYLKLRPSDWEGVLTKNGWLNLETTHVPYSDFLWWRGECPDRVWNHLCTKNVVRERRATGGPVPGFAFRHRFRSAMNSHAGRDSRTVPSGLRARARRLRTRTRA
ncbi:MAG TPA: hypothetical protein VE546_01605 [Streptomyces sp.]|uniref:hypothetical protein n=1 Tax=Streptomyces sp. TaxID=1931 RepID=UPI002D3ACEE7|nr:hypothetical protein [Streptomyces sp.]HZG02267.1 hypothetical protein [Streptomyces sp.]